MQGVVQVLTGEHKTKPNKQHTVDPDNSTAVETARKRRELGKSKENKSSKQRREEKIVSLTIR